MDNFTIYCTQEQTEKALELCAPIEVTFEPSEHREPLLSYDNMEYRCPTAEQMIGWFDGHGIVILVEDTNCNTWFFKLEAAGYVNKYNDYSSRKDATLAAIDAALEYLEACLSKTAIGC